MKKFKLVDSLNKKSRVRHIIACNRYIKKLYEKNTNSISYNKFQIKG